MIDRSIKFLRIASVLLASFEIALTILQYTHYKTERFFIDTYTYVNSVRLFNQGLNAYDLEATIRFPYHAIPLQVFSLAGNYLGEALVFLYVVIGIVFLRALLDQKERAYPVLLAFSYMGVGFTELAGGNITLPLHLLLLGLLIQGLNTPMRTNFFLLMTVLVSLVKPYMLAYIVIPALTSPNEKNSKRLDIKKTILSGLLFALIIGLDYLMHPELTKGFLSSVQQQTLVDGDLGQGFFMMFFRETHSKFLSISLHLLAISLLCGPIIYLLWRNGAPSQHLNIFYLYFLMTMASPRIKEYDVEAALIALFISWSYLQRSVLNEIIFTLAFWVSAIRLLLLFKQHDHPMVMISGPAFYASVLILTFGFIFVLSKKRSERSFA